MGNQRVHKLPNVCINNTVFAILNYFGSGNYIRQKCLNVEIFRQLGVETRWIPKFNTKQLSLLT